VHTPDRPPWNRNSDRTKRFGPVSMRGGCFLSHAGPDPLHIRGVRLEGRPVSGYAAKTAAKCALNPFLRVPESPKHDIPGISASGPEAGYVLISRFLPALQK